MFSSNKKEIGEMIDRSRWDGYFVRKDILLRAMRRINGLDDSVWFHSGSRSIENVYRERDALCLDLGAGPAPTNSRASSIRVRTCLGGRDQSSIAGFVAWA